MDPILRAALHGELAEFKALAEQRKKDNHARLAPSDEPLQWAADRNKLVRLDHAIMACHLLTARVAFRSLPAMARQRLLSLRLQALNYIAGKLLAKIAGAAFGGPRKLVSEVVGYVRANTIELEAEQAIRRQSIRAMRDLRAHILFKNTHRKRKTKTVFTRRSTPET